MEKQKQNKKEKDRAKKKIVSFRKNIDRIDRRIAVLINKRGRIVKKIQRVKESNGIAKRDRRREGDVINNFCRRCSLDRKHSERVIREIVEGGLRNS